MTTQPGRAERVFSAALKALILAAGALGQVVSLRQGGNIAGPFLLYYTNISNILVTVMGGGLLILALKAGRRGEMLLLPRWLLRVRYALTSGILLTFIVFSLLLVPTVPLSYLASPANLFVHNLVPLLACLDFILFRHTREERQPLLTGLTLPFAYVVFSLALSFSGVRFNGRAVPYYFLDFQTNGWFTVGGGTLGVFWWLLILGALTLLLAFLLRGIQRIWMHRIEKPN